MKKQVFLFSTIFVSVFFMFFLISAAEVEGCEDDDANCKIDAAYSCLNDKISDKTCSGLSDEEKVFSLLSTGRCSDEVNASSKYLSDLEFTSQAVIGMNNFGYDTTAAEAWLLSREKVSSGLEWFLEIENPIGETTCTVDYSSSNTLTLGEDRKISSLTGGNCLSLAQGGYWLGIDSSCYDEEFTTTCDKQFLTTLLYQEQGSGTIYVSEATNIASAEASTIEKIKSFCFQTGGTCDYEGSLWASLALNIKGKDVTSYLSYLIPLIESNGNLLPESFLYFITGNIDFKKFLKEKIKEKKGKILSPEGKVIGEHDGVYYYTIGERLGPRYGFEISKDSDDKKSLKRWYVARKNLRKNEIIAAPQNHPLLLRKEIVIRNFRLISKDKENFKKSISRNPKKVLSRIRQVGELLPSKIFYDKRKKQIKLILNKAITGVSQGQAIVLYEGKKVLGGGEIRF